MSVSHETNETPLVPETVSELTRSRTSSQHAQVSLTFGKQASFHAEADITNGGLLSIAALVSSILLSTAVLVHVAARGERRGRRW